MRRKKTAGSKRRWWSLDRKSRRYAVIASVCAIAVLGFVTLAGPYSTSQGARRLRSLFFSAPPPPLPSPGNPSKEYIYAGGRLIATEEPNPLTAPANLVASTISNAQIDLSWNAAPNAHHYQVERASNYGGTFAVLNANVSGTTFTDTSVSSVNAYLYRVRAADAIGNLSPVSNLDLATAITFEDDPFPSPPVFTLVRGQHILQLRQAVNAARATANLGAFSWTQTINSAQPGTVQIKAIDVEELRTALDQALAVLSLPTGGYTDPSLNGVEIQKIHVTQLRDRVK